MYKRQVHGCPTSTLGQGSNSDSWWITYFDSAENQPDTLIALGESPVSCCNEEGECQRSLFEVCFPYNATFAEAEDLCGSMGMRLCRSDEINSGNCCGKGCQFDRQYTWVNNSKYILNCNSDIKEGSFESFD